MRANLLDFYFNKCHAEMESYVALAMHEKQIVNEIIAPLHELHAFSLRCLDVIGLQKDLLLQFKDQYGSVSLTEEQVSELNEEYQSKLIQLCENNFYPNFETTLKNRCVYDHESKQFIKLTAEERHQRRNEFQSEIAIYQENPFLIGEAVDHQIQSSETILRQIDEKINRAVDSKNEIGLTFLEAEAHYADQHRRSQIDLDSMRQQLASDVGSLIEQGQLEALKEKVKAAKSKSERLSLLNTASGPLQLPALHTACLKGQTEIIHYVLAQGGNPCQLTHDGKTIAHLAVEQENPQTSAILDILSSTKGSKALLRQKNKHNRTLLHTSCEYGNLAAVQWWFSHGKGEVNVQDTKYQKTALHYAIAPHLHAWSAQRLPLITLLLQQGASAYIENALGETPLVSACVRHHMDCISIFLRHGITLREKDITYLRQDKIWNGLSQEIRTFVNRADEQMQFGFISLQTPSSLRQQSIFREIPSRSANQDDLSGPFENIDLHA